MNLLNRSLHFVPAPRTLPLLAMIVDIGSGISFLSDEEKEMIRKDCFVVLEQKTEV
jgi:hypothetical protein